MTVVDNSSKDKDPAIGFAYYATTSSAASTVDMGTLVGPRKPTFRLVAGDELGQLALGATYSLTYQFNSALDVIVKDGDAVLDESTGADGVGDLLR